MAISIQSEPSSIPRTGGLRITTGDLGTTSTITLEGGWDLAEQRVLRQAVHAALARQPEYLVLDLSRLSFMDSTGVHGVIEFLRHAERLGVSLVLVPGPRAVQRVSEIAEMAAVLPFSRT